uniref:ATP synthase F0 subunit 8 n=1 Tax=Hermatobates djiboutensis TaxID=301294 RepID=UPI002E78007A|nr:ATP synthase F0 subunit 8 [Hermatobates djiboutensis]WPW46687.1 ATP synthase F0 subunit 8 [Hermatobates djiboutensis]
MPQMSPMWWSTLFMLFIASLMLMNSMIYFNKKFSIKKSSKSTKKNSMNWQW